MTTRRDRLYCFVLLVAGKPGEENYNVEKVWEYINTEGTVGIVANPEIIPLESLEVFNDIDRANFVYLIKLFGLSNFAPGAFGTFDSTECKAVYEEMQRAYFLLPQQMVPVRGEYYSSMLAGHGNKQLIREIVEMLHNQEQRYVGDFLVELDNNATW